MVVVPQQEMAQLLLKSSAAMWVSGLNVPWFLAGAGVGVPAAVGTMATGNSKLLGLVTTLGGILGGIAADHLSTTFSNDLSLANDGGGGFTCYDLLTKAVGPACLLLVVLSGRLRGEPSVAVKPAAAVALAALILEPLFSAYVLGSGGSAYSTASTAAAAAAVAGGGGDSGVTRLLSPKRFLGLIGGGSGKKDATAAAAAAAAASSSAAAAAAAASAASLVARARYLTAGAQVTLWAAVVLAYANLTLRVSRGAPGRTVGGYMTALRTLASKERGNGGWARIGNGGGYGESSDGVGSRPRAQGVLGSLYESLMGRGGGRVCSEAMELSQRQQANYDGPPFERGEVTVRNIYCFGLDAAITGRPPSASLNNSSSNSNGAGGVGGADGGGGGLIAGGSSRPFYVTVSLGGLTSKTSPRQGFSPRFTEVFPLGVDCPIRGAFITIAVVDSFEAGRSGRGDRSVGEVHLPLDAAQLVPDSDSFSSSPSPFSSGNDGAGIGDSEAAYRLRGEWELQGALGDPLAGARVGADIVVRGPPSPTSAAGRLRRRRRESVGWYAR